MNFRDFVLLFSLLPKDPIIWSMKTDACILATIRQCFAGAKPTSLGMISACWKGGRFMTSPKESCASILLFFLFFFFLFSFLTHTHTCMKIGSCLVSRTQKRFLSVPQHCFSRVIAVHCTGGWRRGEESMLSSNVDMSQMADRGL